MLDTKSLRPEILHLLAVAEQYLAAAGLAQEKTVSHRVFGDSKTIARLRAGADITLGRYHAALAWFAANWPPAARLPAGLAPYVVVAPPASPAHSDPPP
jgi:hypothetical protein